MDSKGAGKKLMWSFDSKLDLAGAFLSVAWPTGVQLVFFSSSVISVVMFDTLWMPIFLDRVKTI